MTPNWSRTIKDQCLELIVLLSVCCLSCDSIIKVPRFYFFLRYEKSLDESVHKLNKVWEAVKPKNQFQNELLPNETISGSHLSKMGSQTHRSPTEFANPRLKSRPKNVILNKCIRTSAIEIQVSS